MSSFDPTSSHNQNPAMTNSFVQEAKEDSFVQESNLGWQSAVNAALVAKITRQKDRMTIQEICEANNMRKGQVAWILYVAPKQLDENSSVQSESKPKSSVLRRLKKLVLRNQSENISQNPWQKSEAQIDTRIKLYKVMNLMINLSLIKLQTMTEWWLNEPAPQINERTGVGGWVGRARNSGKQPRLA